MTTAKCETPICLPEFRDRFRPRGGLLVKAATPSPRATERKNVSHSRFDWSISYVRPRQFRATTKPKFCEPFACRIANKGEGRDNFAATNETNFVAGFGRAGGM